jgi:Ca2+-binding RTX toxin-like protein
MVSCDNSTHRPAEEIKMQRTTVSLCFALLLAAPLLAEDAPAAPAEPNFLATGGATIQIGPSTSYFKLQVKVVKSGGGWDHNEVTVCRVDNGINVDEATWNPAPIDEGMFWQTSGFGLQIYVGKPDHADVLVATSGGSYGDYMAVMIGLSGDDVLIGSKNEDWILGNEGDDVVLGASYKDHIWGGAGDDALAGEGGDDEIVGGSEGDNGSFDALPPGTSAPPGNGLVGGDGNDKIWGEGGRDTLWGDADDDSLIGGPASDTLDGGEGLDKLWGGAGHDGLDGGAGNDVLYGEDGSDACYGGADADHVYAGTGDDAPVCGYVSGGLYPELDGVDVICGGIGNDTIFCGEGNDVVNGGAGQDTIHGDKGHDDIWGDADWDEIHGGTEDDFIDGEGGGGILNGDDGNDGIQEIDGQTHAAIDGGSGDDAINCFDLNTAIEDLVVSWSGDDEQGNDEIWADETGFQWSQLGDLVFCGPNDVWHVQPETFVPGSGNLKPQEP